MRAASGNDFCVEFVTGAGKAEPWQRKLRVLRDAGVALKYAISSQAEILVAKRSGLTVAALI